MKAWHITDWDKYYEVNSDGGRWQTGQKKRAKPPEYLRWYVGGPDGNDRAYQECALAVADKFGLEAWAVAFALFGKLLEIAATQDTKFRGYILGKNHSPISTKLLSFITFFTMEQVELGIKILSDPAVGWLEECELPNCSASLGETPGDSLSSAETSGDSPSLQEAKAKTNSKKKEKEKAKSEGEPEVQPPDHETNPAGSPASSSPDSHRSLEPTGGTDQQPFSAAQFAISAHQALQLGKGDSKQYQADIRDFQRAANHILVGRLGKHTKTIVESYLTRAWEIGRDGAVRNKAAYWLTWFKARLEEKGHSWDDG